jgi:hypothetical protein
MVSLLLDVEDMPTAAELRRYEVFQMHVPLDPADAGPPLTTITFRFAGPHAVDNAQRFVAERDTMLDEFVVTTDSGLCRAHNPRRVLEATVWIVS